MQKITSLIVSALLSLCAMAQLTSGQTGVITSVRSDAQGTVTPSTIDMTTIVGVTVTSTITITNTGTVTFTPLTALSSDYGFIWIDTDAISQEVHPLPENNVLEVTVTYTPTLAGTHNAVLNVKIGDVIHYVSMHGTALVRGDANNDGNITISDVTTLINNLLSGGDYNLAMDCNMDGVISITDVTVLINYLLSGLWPEPQPEPEMEPGVIAVNGVAFKMMPVKSGTFTMGATSEQGNDGFNFEQPTHDVTLSSYYISETEVTQALWKAVMGTAPSYFPGDLMRPVEQVSWNDCQQFITKLNQMTGYNFRLPTEAEWEYAARGGQGSNGYKYSGSNNINEVCWYSYNSSNVTHPVASLAPNELGLYDMSGNVFEWCQDWYGDYTADAQVNPSGPAEGTARVCRGGAWIYDPVYERISYRYYNTPDTRDIDLGFRLAIDSTFTPPTEPPFTLSCLEVNMAVEDVVKVGINNGSGNYSLSCSIADIVGCEIEGDSIVLTGLAPGTTKVTLTDTRTQNEITFPVKVTPKDNAVTFVVNGIPFKMVPVEGGTFMMGATEEQGTDATATEKPAHPESVSDFMIGQTEVTQALWLAVMGSNPSEHTTTLQHPVECVSWNDCQEFIVRLNQLTGQEFRLPSEAEWEYAARGGNRSEGYKYSGSNDIGNVAWYFMNACVVGSWSPNYGTHPVAKKSPNELGLYDMSGNVFEWCQDLYSQYTSDPLNIPTTPSNDSTYVYRGGGWGTHDTGCRVSSRASHVYSVTAGGIGLRLACNAALVPGRLALSEYELNMDTGVTHRVKIINGSGHYSLSYDSTLVECHITDGDILVVTPLKAGNPTITVTDDDTHTQVELTIIAIDAETITVGNEKIRMIKVEGGSFMMGASNEVGSNANPCEKPAHKVNVSTFYIMDVVVTQKLWESLMGYNANHTGDNHPYFSNVFNNNFVTKLNQKTGRKFRLPTEAEWEFAARGGNKSQGYLYAGSNDPDEVAWTIDNSGGTLHDVATKKPNELLLYDMSGNVLEWCLDTYNDYDIGEQTDPLFIGVNAYSNRIYRGGSVNDSIGMSRVSWRSSDIPSVRNYGYRLVISDVNDVDALALSCTKKSITIGGETSVEILNGSGEYNLEYNNSIISSQIVDGNLVATGLAIGSTTVVVTDQQTQQQCTLEVSVIPASTYTVNGVSFAMIPVEGGTFTMGATEEQAYAASADESPAHEVTLSDFAIGQTEVTHELWNAVMGGTSTVPLRPRTNVTDEEIKAFIGRLNAITGVKFRLPTEAEWEYAARGGNKSQGYIYSGSNVVQDVAWFKYNTSNNILHDVALKQPNELGLYDMSGNALELCMDYRTDYTAEAQTDPCNLTSGSWYSNRGGYYSCLSNRVRVASRFGFIQSSSGYSDGFRLVMGSAQPSPELTIIPYYINMNVGEQKSATVKYGSGNYALSKDNDIITWEQDSDKIIFIATAPGNVHVTIEDVLSHEQTGIDISIVKTTNYTVNGVSFDLVDVEGGTFTMGISGTSQAHEVTLSDFSIGQTEVTKELWQAVMGGSATTNLKTPITSITWNKCQEFIMKLNAITGENFRLPTEAEWEYAALGGNQSHEYTYSGSNDVGEVAWYTSNSSSRVHDVRTKKPNELMLFDMSGNVREFCYDTYDSRYSDETVNPTGAVYGSSVVVKGGDYYNSANWCEVKKRASVERTQSYAQYGLRLAKGEAVASPTITLMQNDVALSVGGTATVNIAYSTGSCHLVYDESILNCQLSGQSISITGNKVGAANVIVYDDLANCQTTLSVLVKDTETITVNGVSFEMVNLPGGTFLMGATVEQAHTINITSYSNEVPVHEVTLSPFSIGQTEVTQELWLAVMGSNPSEFNYDLQCPVDNVSWSDCQQFITQLNSLTGRHFRLPTEAQWEYSARGGNSQRFVFSGSNSIGNVAWYSSNSSSKSHPVAQKQANAIGLYDMTGNIEEWCQDWYGYYSAEPQTDPTGPETGSYYVIRGSNWSASSQSRLKNAYRGLGSDAPSRYTGLRLVMVSD